MKRTPIITFKTASAFGLLACALTVFAQNGAAQHARLSATAQAFAEYLNAQPQSKTGVLPDSIITAYRLKARQGRYWIDALVELDKNTDAEALRQSGARVRTVAGDVASVFAPVDRFGEVVRTPGLRFFQWADLGEPALQEARGPEGANVEPVYLGEGFERAYRGKGVIVGVIDQGFDFTHPTFYDESETELRISRCWDQLDSDSAASPQGYGYGREIVGQAALEEARHDVWAVHKSHGTHVAGIAAGSGAGTGGACRGVAPESELVLVNSNYSDAQVVDAVNYIIEYAEAQDKPAVINMSFGWWFKPLDGNNLLDKALDELQGAGNIIIAGMGNEGRRPNYVFAPVRGVEDTASTFFINRYYGNPNLMGRGFTIGEINIRPDSGASLALEFALLAADGAVLEDAGFFAFEELPQRIDLRLEQPNTLYRIFMDDVYQTNDHYPVKKRVRLTFAIEEGESAHPAAAGLRVRAVSDGNWIRMYAPFDELTNAHPASGAQLHGCLPGKRETNGRSPGASARQVLGVGSYNTKTEAENLNGGMAALDDNGALFNLSEFSSRGPTYDGRVKPAVVAPGSHVVSALSSSNSRFTDLESDSTTVIYEVLRNGTNYHYGANYGTSMATPMVAGAVALMLEIDPELTISELRDILQTTSRRDGFTGQIPDSGSNDWGHGKLDVDAALRYMLSSTSVGEVSGEADGFAAYPVPAAERLWLNWPEDAQKAPVSVALNDLRGATVLQTNVRTDALDLGGIAPGVYVLRAESGGNAWTRKVIVAR